MQITQDNHDLCSRCLHEPVFIYAWQGGRADKNCVVNMEMVDTNEAEVTVNYFSTGGLKREIMLRCWTADCPYWLEHVMVSEHVINAE